MLFPLLAQVSLDIAGVAPATLFARATGLSHMTFHRGDLAAVLRRNHEKVGRHREVWLLEQLTAAGATEEEIDAVLTELPDAPAAQWVFWLGLLDDNASEVIRETVARLDEADVRLCELLHRNDPENLLHELGSGSPLGSHYSECLDVAGIEPCRTGGKVLVEEEYRSVTLTRRAHMALSLLAAVDHELGRWSVQVYGADNWAGHSRFAALLCEPVTEAHQRLLPSDPIARLVDLVGAGGAAMRAGGRWPSQALTIKEMGAQAEMSHVISGDGERYIRNLRCGKTKLTGSAFRTLVRSQSESGVRPPDPEVAKASDLLMPYLFAAHLFTRLMQPLQGKPRHLDRAGWREAYRMWWHKYAEVCSRPEGRAANRPPLWLCGP